MSTSRNSKTIKILFPLNPTPNSIYRYISKGGGRRPGTFVTPPPSRNFIIKSCIRIVYSSIQKLFFFWSSKTFSIASFKALWITTIFQTNVLLTDFKQIFIFFISYSFHNWAPAPGLVWKTTFSRSSRPNPTKQYSSLFLNFKISIANKFKLYFEQFWGLRVTRQRCNKFLCISLSFWIKKKFKL